MWLKLYRTKSVTSSGCLKASLSNSDTSPVLSEIPKPPKRKKKKLCKAGHLYHRGPGNKKDKRKGKRKGYIAIKRKREDEKKAWTVDSIEAAGVSDSLVMLHSLWSLATMVFPSLQSRCIKNYVHKFRRSQAVSGVLTTLRHYSLDSQLSKSCSFHELAV